MVLTVVGVKRVVMKDFGFSDGLVISPGEILAMDQRGVHMNPKLYPCPDDFDGFRFSRMREEGETSRIYTTNTSTEFLTFGHGKHAWY
jgi:cytochrome P450